MKILQVITSLHTGGAEKLLTEIVPLMREKGHQVDVALFNGTETSFKTALQSCGCKVYSFSSGSSVYNPMHIYRLAKLMGKYDIVHTHNTAPQLFAAIGSVLCSVVLCTTEHTTSNRRRGWKWYARIDRWMYSRYKHVICISPKTEEFLKDFIGNSKTPISTIYNGVNLKEIENASASGFRNEYPQCHFAITQVAGFRYQKDQPTLIRAMASLPDHMHLFLVGIGDKMEECKQLVESLRLENRVHFMGLRTDVGSLLKASDLVVMSSHWEGFGLAAVEGMAAGKPVIASDVDGLRQVVEGAGVLFRHGDSDDLVAKIMALEANPRLYESVSNACLERAKQYDISKMVDGYLKVYDEICSK